MSKNEMFRKIPNMNLLLKNEQMIELSEVYGRELIKEAINLELEKLRQMIAEDAAESELEAAVNGVTEKIAGTVRKLAGPDIHHVINGTGTILHTNLGRAPISEEHMRYLAEVACGYSNLEYDLEAGKRGERYSHFEELLCKITGAEAAMAVNNNASSVLLILSTLAKGGEAIVSRGELIEIGGKFRIPDVMEQSGATLVEVGTTNKTHPEDYEEAITEETKAILKVHTSNYRIVGFTQSVTAAELSPIAKAHDIPLIEDMGSGALIDLEQFGLHHEPTVQEAIRAGVDIVCFSGDKLLGGPQAGIIVGKKKYLAQLKKHPLTRALRIDKFTVTALELALREYQSEARAIQNIPVLRMIAKKTEELQKEARSLARKLRNVKIAAEISVIPCSSQIGGGSLPLEIIPSMAVAVRPERISVTEMERALHHARTPVFGRVVNDQFQLDLRTMDRKDYKTAVSEFAAVCGCRE